MKKLILYLINGKANFKNLGLNQNSKLKAKIRKEN